MTRDEMRALVIALVTAERAKDREAFDTVMAQLHWDSLFPFISELANLTSVLLDLWTESYGGTSEQSLQYAGFVLQRDAM